jgi:Sigma-70, region 4
LITGTRLVPLDLRRARGARGRLKKTLVDGPGNGADRPHRLKDFSSAMDRQAVGEALNALPLPQREVVKLAYFGGMTNREIADRLGVPVGGVRHRLRRALAAAGDYVERGRATGRKVVYLLVAWLCGRSFESTQRTSGAAAEHILRASMVVAAGVTASAVLGLAHSPVQPTLIEPANQPSAKAAIPAAAAKTSQTTVVSNAVNQVSDVPAVPVTVSVASPPVNLPIPVSVPTEVSLAIPISVPTPIPVPIPIPIPIPIPLPIPTPTVPPLP